MSKSITIQEKGVAKNLNTIAEIETAKQGGGTVTWVPEEERKVMKKTITKKGKYKAKDDDVYAYSEVVVKLAKSSAADKPKKKAFTEIAPDITIQEGGVGKAMYNIKKLRVSEQGSSDTVTWIPEDNVKTETLSAQGNGTFVAKDMGYFGFSEVTVSEKVNVVTKDDGNEYAQWDVDGELEEEKIPSSIKVITPPQKTEYHDGEDIDITGIVVKAYYGDGTEYENVISINELSIEPTTASGGNEYSDGDGVNAVAISVTNQYSYRDFAGAPLKYLWGTPYHVLFEGNRFGVGFKDESGGHFSKVLMTKYQNEIYWVFDVDYVTLSTFYEYLVDDENIRLYGSLNYNDAKSFKLNNLQLYQQGELLISIPESTSDPTAKGMDDLSASNLVTVKWTRIDGTVLTDTFEISMLN